MAAKRVLIRNREGVEYSVTEATYEKLYADEGFKIVSNEDGTKHEPPAKSRSKSDDEG